MALGKDITGALLKSAGFIRKSVEMTNCFLQWRRLIFGGGEAQNGKPPESETAPSGLGGHTDMARALMLAGALPELEERYNALGIGRDVLSDSLFHFAACMDDHYSEYGEYGITERSMKWLIYTFTGRLFRLGRLQFMHARFDAEIQEPDDSSRRFPMSGDDILDVHIPAGPPPLAPGPVHESYRAALRFYGRFFPELQITSFHCYSWLLSPVLKKLLPPESNIIKFLTGYYIFETEEDGNRNVFKHLFRVHPDDPADLPDSTSLLKAAKRYIIAGGCIYPGRGVLPVSKNLLMEGY